MNAAPLADTGSVSVDQNRHGTAVLAARIVFAGAAALLAVIAFRAQRGFWFVADEWDVLAHYVDGHYLTPYNGHLSIVPVLVYQGLAGTVGIGSYRPYGTIGIIVFLAIPVAFALTHRSRVDERLVWAAALAIAWSWAAQMNLMYGFLINFDIPVVMLMIAWWAIRRDRVRADLLAIAALTIALASSSVGIIVAFAIGAELLLARVPLRRLVRFAPPVVAWVLWWVARHDTTASASTGEYVRYAWHMGVAILAGFTWGWKPGAVLVAAAVIVILVFAHRQRSIDAHVVATLITLVVFIALTSYSRAGELWLNPPDSSRYVFLGDILLLAGLVWCLRDRVLHAAVPAGCALLAVFGAIPLVGHIGDHRDYVLAYRARTVPYLAEVEAAGAAADPGRNLPLNLIPVTNAQYLRLVARVGSPNPDLPPNRLGNRSDRRQADRLLIGDEHIALAPAPDGAACAGPKRTVTTTEQRLDPGSRYLVSATASRPITVSIRRFAAPGAGSALGTIPSGSTKMLSIPHDHSNRPWWVSADGPTTVCPIGAGSRND